ncbi:helix-turn-helix domain-containing protein [Sphingomonas populi]|uniref:Helix-turn-helix domain-containing protein n=1 Tax=Sphingomonas populi TaxID=2484750 RepID=A0A4Q6Y7G2_9SPHN|nr:DJ-1/PfpI family protein [Sphingomonas populi]RZF65459.1 helix-turn-helix domain-containing protein [Sphingomonas populi]
MIDRRIDSPVGPGPQPLRVVLLAYDGMNLLDLAGPLQALTTANRSAVAGDPARYETIVASGRGGPVVTSSGLPVVTVPVTALGDVPIDTLIAPGGCWGEEFDVEPALRDFIIARAKSVRRLCSVCTGAFLLAAAGQLDGHRVATHWAWLDKLKRQHPTLDVDADSIFIRDGSLWTSAGVSSGIDLTLALIEEDFGPRIAIDAARQMVVFMKRAGGQSQFSVPLAAQTKDHAFVELHAWMAANFGSDLSVPRLAERACMAPRTFARVYSAKVGQTPAKTVERMRLEAACRALEETNLPLKSVAVQSGYGDEQRLRRAFQRQFGTNPVTHRARFSRH